MKKTLYLLFTLLFLAAGSAFAQDVKYNFDKDADFSKFKTYKWVSIKNADQVDELTARQLTSTIDAELAKKGLTKTDSDSADLYIGYQTAIGTEKQITAYNTGTGWGYGPGWGGGWYGYGGMGMNTTTATTSTIVTGQLDLDMYEAAKKQLVWRGVASKTLNPSSNPEKRRRIWPSPSPSFSKPIPPRRSKLLSTILIRGAGLCWPCSLLVSPQSPLLFSRATAIPACARCCFIRHCLQHSAPRYPLPPPPVLTYRVHTPPSESPSCPTFPSATAVPRPASRSSPATASARKSRPKPSRSSRPLPPNATAHRIHRVRLGRRQVSPRKNHAARWRHWRCFATSSTRFSSAHSVIRASPPTSTPPIFSSDSASSSISTSTPAPPNSFMPGFTPLRDRTAERYQHGGLPRKHGRPVRRRWRHLQEGNSRRDCHPGRHQLPQGGRAHHPPCLRVRSPRTPEACGIGPAPGELRNPVPSASASAQDRL